MTAASLRTAPDQPEAQSLRPRPARRADIQGLRALAVILVVLYHADVPALSGGFVGVDVFFVVSGFVITRMLLTEQRATDAIRLAPFYLRRSRRLLPALSLMLCATMALDVVLGPIGTQAHTVKTGWAAALFSANVYLVGWGRGGYFNAPARANPLLHTWSLSLEEQFYFVFPALLLVAAWAVRTSGRGRRTTAQLLVIGAIGVASFGLCVLTTRGQLGPEVLDQRFAFFLAPARFWQFGLGAVLAMVAHRLPRSRPLAEIAGWGGLALVLWSALTFSDASAFPGWIASIPTVGAALAIVGGTHVVSSASRSLSVTPMVWTGDRSYSWYLWHWPLIVFARSLWPGSEPALLAAAAISLVPALASYRWIEQPIRHRPAVPRPTVRLAAICIATPLVVGGLALAATRVVDRSDAVAVHREQIRLHLDATAGCFGNAAPLASGTCTWPADGRGVEAVDHLLLGDSNAGQLSEPFVAVANDAGRNATIRTAGVCPFIDLTVSTAGVPDQRCHRQVEDLLEQIEAVRPEVVVISNATDGYLDDPAMTLTAPDGTKATTTAEKVDLWSDALRATVERIRRTGSGVVVVEPIAKFDTWDPQECAPLRVMVDADSCSTSGSLAELRARRASSTRAVRTAVGDDDPGTVVVDPFPLLCSADPCEATRDGELWWRDWGHVSVRGAAELQLALADAVDSAAASARR